MTVFKNFQQPKIVAALRNPAYSGSVIGYSADGKTYKRDAAGWHPVAKVIEGYSIDEVVAIRINQGWTEIDLEQKARQQRINGKARHFNSSMSKRPYKAKNSMQ